MCVLIQFLWLITIHMNLSIDNERLLSVGVYRYTHTHQKCKRRNKRNSRNENQKLKSPNKNRNSVIFVFCHIQMCMHTSKMRCVVMASNHKFYSQIRKHKYEIVIKHIDGNKAHVKISNTQIEWRVGTRMKHAFVCVCVGVCKTLWVQRLNWHTSCWWWSMFRRFEITLKYQ